MSDRQQMVVKVLLQATATVVSRVAMPSPLAVANVKAPENTPPPFLWAVLQQATGFTTRCCLTWLQYGYLATIHPDHAALVTQARSPAPLSHRILPK